MDVDNDEEGGPPTRKQYAVELHRRAVQPPVVRKVLTTGLDDCWTSDHRGPFGDASKNDGKRYFLVVMDCFSRYAWAVSQTEPTAASTWKVFADIMKTSGRKPKALWTDEGLFKAADFAGPLAKAGIELYHTFSEHKAVQAERLIKTFELSLAREMTANDTTRWVDILPGVVRRYNETKHSALGVTPTEASEPSMEAKLHHHLYAQYLALPQPKARYALDTWVRVSAIKRQFEKAADANWSTPLFKIVGIDYSHVPARYTLEDEFGNIVPGGDWYESQLAPSVFTPATQKELIAPDRKAGPDEVEAVIDWRKDPKDKGKFPYSVRVRHGDGTESDWLPLRLYIGRQREKTLKFYATTNSPNQILRPFDKFVQSIPELRENVWEKLD